MYACTISPTTVAFIGRVHVFAIKTDYDSFEIAVTDEMAHSVGFDTLDHEVCIIRNRRGRG